MLEDDDLPQKHSGLRKSFEQDRDGNNSEMLIDRTDGDEDDQSAEAESQKLVMPREEFQIFPEGVYIEQSASIFSEKAEGEDVDGEKQMKKVKTKPTPL